MTKPPEPEVTFDPRRPFTRAAALANQLTDAKLRTKAYQRLFHGIYLCSSVQVTPAVRAQAALCAVGEGAYASHLTAAELWGIPTPPDGLTHLTAPPGEGRNRRRGIVTHRLRTGAATTQREGVPTSTPEQAFCELAAGGVGLVDLVVAGDALLRTGHATRETLERAVRGMSCAGVTSARRALGYVRDGVDSPMESRLRMLLVLAGFPEPQVNVILRGEGGRWVRRFDLCYRSSMVIVEYDGRQHADDPEQWENDIYRREELERQGYTIVVITSRGIYRDPAGTLARVAEALKAAGAPVARRWSPEWRLHFPSRV